MDLQFRDNMLHCPCYDAHEEFQKIVDLKNTGVVIYRLNSHLKYINEESVMKSTSKNPEDIFILHNTKENDIISANVMEAFDKYGISCPRCIHLLKSAKKMLEIVPKVKGNEIMGVCDHCLKKLTSCIKCDKVVKEFLKTRKDDDSECKKQNLKKHLSKVNILLNDVIWKNKLVREKSGILSHLNFLNLRHNTPALSPEPEIDNALDPGTMRKSSPWARLRRHRSLHIHPGVTKTKRGKTVTKNVLFSSRSHEDLTYGDDWSSIGDDDTLHSETLNSADEATRKSHDMNFEFNKEHDSKIDKTIYDNYETTKNWRDINFELNKQRDSKIDKLKNKQYIKLETDVDTKSILDTLKLTKSMPDVHTVFEKSLLHTLSQKYNSEDSFLNVISGLDDDQLNNGFEYCFPKEVDDSTKKLPRLASSSELISNTQNMLREIAEKERNKREEEHSRKRKEKEEKQIALKEKRSKEKERLLHEEETKEKKEIAFDDTKKEKTLTDDDLKHNLERTKIEAESIEQKKEIETIENVESKQTKEASKKNKIEQSHNQKVVITRDKLKKVKEKSYDEPVESKEEPSSSNRKQLTKSLSDKTTEDLKKGFSKNRDNKDISITEKDVQHTRDRKKPLNDSMSKREDVVTKKEKELEDTIERKKKDSNMKSDKDNETKKERHKKDLRPAHEESKEKSSKEIENVNSKSPVKDNEQKKTKENDAKNVKENNAGKDDKAAADEFLKLLAAQNKQKEEDSKQKKLMEDQQRKANEAADKATSNVTKKQSSPHTKKPAKKLPSPLSPKTKRDHFEPNKADLSITHIKMKKQSGDDLLLRLVRLHKSGARKILYKKNDEQKARDMLARHKRHNKDLKNGCIICNQSDIELELESLLGHKNIGDEFANMIIGEKIYKYKAPLKDEQISIFKLADKNIEEIEKKNEEPPEKECLKTPSPVTAKGTKATEQEPPKGIIRYTLSDRSFIDKGWTLLPTEKVVRKMNVYRMRPAHPEFDWFEHNKSKRLMQYDSGEKLAEFNENGRGRWFYKNGRVALDYYDAEETNAQQRFVVYSSGEPDERGRSRPFTILATFDYLGNGVVFDHTGKIRLKYNQTEGVVLDRAIGPVSHWKWHTLNDPPVLQQVMIDTQMPYKDPTILKLGKNDINKSRPDNEDMLAIEFDNFIKEKSKKLSQTFKPFQIRMKALKINEQFSLKVLDQATIYLIFRDGSANLKLNLGMILDHREIVDTDTAEVGEVSNSLERLPARTDSIARLQSSVAHAQHIERLRTDRERWLRPTAPTASVDQLTAAASSPMKPPFRTVPSNTSVSCACKCRKLSSNLYYDTRLV